MFKFLFRIAIIAIIGLVVYNYIWGNESEKAGSKRILSETKDLFVGIKDLISSEKTKFDAGKYDDALDKIKGVLQKIDRSGNKLNADKKARLELLQKQHLQLQEELKSVENGNSADQAKQKDKIKDEMDQLMKETEALLKEISEE
ncbi:MAG: hypothetical protein ABIV51_09755 [Saprospiraceae bacterium]